MPKFGDIYILKHDNIEDYFLYVGELNTPEGESYFGFKLSPYIAEDLDSIDSIISDNGNRYIINKTPYWVAEELYFSKDFVESFLPIDTIEGNAVSSALIMHLYNEKEDL